MKIKFTFMALLVLCISSCGDEDISAPTSSSVYSLQSAFHHESEDCTGEETNIIDSMELTITLNNDLSYSYSLNDTLGEGNWADGTFNLDGNDANFTINEDSLQVHMFSSIDTLYSSTYLPAHMIVYPCDDSSSGAGSLCIIDEVWVTNFTNQDQCESNDGIWVVLLESESPDSTIIYQNGDWTEFISGYCDTESDNQIETLEDCQSVNGSWITSETGTWDPANQTFNMEGWDTLIIAEDSLTLFMAEAGENNICLELTMLLENQVYQTDVDCTYMLLILD